MIKFIIRVIERIPSKNWQIIAKKKISRKLTET